MYSNSKQQSARLLDQQSVTELALYFTLVLKKISHLKYRTFSSNTFCHMEPRKSFTSHGLRRNQRVRRQLIISLNSQDRTSPQAILSGHQKNIIFLNRDDQTSDTRHPCRPKHLNNHLSTNKHGYTDSSGRQVRNVKVLLRTICSV